MCKYSDLFVIGSLITTLPYGLMLSSQYEMRLAHYIPTQNKQHRLYLPLVKLCVSLVCLHTWFGVIGKIINDSCISTRYITLKSLMGCICK